MARYIELDALLAEIEKKEKYAQTLGDNAINSSMQQFYDGMKQGCVDILSSIDALEVKEVDLAKEIEEQCKKVNQLAVGKELRNICRFFFELGLKAQKGD